jgi:hypothetical protein
VIVCWARVMVGEFLSVSNVLWLERKMFSRKVVQSFDCCRAPRGRRMASFGVAMRGDRRLLCCAFLVLVQLHISHWITSANTIPGDT